MAAHSILPFWDEGKIKALNTPSQLKHNFATGWIEIEVPLPPHKRTVVLEKSDLGVEATRSLVITGWDFRTLGMMFGLLIGFDVAILLVASQIFSSRLGRR